MHARDAHMRAYAMHTLVRMRTPMRTPWSPSPLLRRSLFLSESHAGWAQWGPGASAATRPGATVRPGQTPAIVIGPTTGMHLSSTWPGVAAHRRGRGPVSAIFHYTQCSSACNKSNWGLRTVEIVSRASDRDAGGGGAASVWAPPRRGRVPPPGTMCK